MKRLILFATLLTSTWASATLFTAVKSGNWNDPTVWGNTAGTGTCHTGVSAIPCMTDAGNAGDTVSLAGFTVTCPTGVTCSAGNSGATLNSLVAGTAAIVNLVNTGGLTCQAGAIIVYAGPVDLLGTTTLQSDGTTPCQIYHDDSWAASPAGYTWQDNQNNATHGTWAVGNASYWGTSYPYVIWEGDSYQSPLRKTSGTCTSALQTACFAGIIGYGTTFGESGEGTFYNLWLRNIQGNTVSSPAQTAAWVTYASSASSTSTFHGLLITNSAIVILKTGGTNSFLTLDGIHAIGGLNDNNASSTGCVYLGLVTTGTNTLTNSVFQCPFSFPTIAKNLTMTNVMCNGDNSGQTYSAATPYNVRPCSFGVSQHTYTQTFWYVDPWFNTTTPNTNAKAVIPTCFVRNSVIWVDANGSSAIHVNALQGSTGSLLTASCQLQQNVYGSMGDNQTAGTESAQFGMSQGGNPAAAVTFVSTNEIALCGAYGRGSMGVSFTQLSAAINTNVTSMATRGASLCSSSASLATAQQSTGGNMQIEVANLGNKLITLSSGLFFRNDGVGAGAVPEIFDTATGGNAIYNCSTGTSPCPFNAIQYNAVVNTNTGAAPCGTNQSNCAWTFNGGTNMTASQEMILQNEVLHAGDVTRSVPTFSEYLDKAGLFTYNGTNQYASGAQVWLNGGLTTTSYQGLWVTGTSYTVGQIVYVDPTVAGGAYNNVYGGHRTFWICKENHTAGTTNQPIIAVDGTNPRAENTRYWQVAWYSMYAINAVLPSTPAGPTTYVDGALPPLITDAVTYLPGLLNRWLRAGYIVNDWRIWAGTTTGTSGCSDDGGSTYKECGAVPLNPIQHNPPATVAN